jgi:hypothetical protein
MRRLLDKSVMLRAVAAGLILTGACLPYVWSQPGPPALALLRSTALLPIVIILFQAGLAWTPLADGQAMFRSPADRDLPLFAVAALVVGVLGPAFLHPLLEQANPGCLPKSAGELLVALPWLAGFQPLLLIVGIFAFAVRLSRSALAGTAAVVLLRQAAFLTQWHSAATEILLLVLLMAGVTGVLLVLSFRRFGYWGLCLVSLLLELPLLVRLMR